jgi:hypothetical protein
VHPQPATSPAPTASKTAHVSWLQLAWSGIRAGL